MIDAPFRRDEVTLTTTPPDLAAPALVEEDDAATAVDVVDGAKETVRAATLAEGVFLHTNVARWPCPSVGAAPSVP